MSRELASMNQPAVHATTEIPEKRIHDIRTEVYTFQVTSGVQVLLGWIGTFQCRTAYSGGRKNFRIAIMSFTGYLDVRQALCILHLTSNRLYKYIWSSFWALH